MWNQCHDVSKRSHIFCRLIIIPKKSLDKIHHHFFGKVIVIKTNKPRDMDQGNGLESPNRYRKKRYKQHCLAKAIHKQEQPKPETKTKHKARRTGHTTELKQPNQQTKVPLKQRSTQIKVQ